ncbi:PAS domain-containing protein [Oceanibaculum pacificum]|uniref:hypothetical protein n=1 Tax=Oceanibaculum pacificum TaxID=580166 RepID=UPI0012ED0C8F|nr:hypothetical protein [Oceanibaculum pacificum]
MSTSQLYIDRDLQRCHDLLNLANLLLAQNEFDRASATITELREACQAIPAWHAHYFQRRLIRFNLEHARRQQALSEDGTVVDLAKYRRHLQKKESNNSQEKENFSTNISVGRRAIPAISEDERGNFIYRMPMALDDVNYSDSYGMEFLLSMWKETKLKKKNALPLLSDINPIVFADIGMLGYVHVIDVSHADPSHFSVQVYGSRVTLHNGQNLSGLSVGDLPISIYRQAIGTDYNTARMTGMPAYHRIVATIDDSRRHYTRLILPFSTDGMRPDRLLVGVRVDNWLVE